MLTIQQEVCQNKIRIKYCTEVCILLDVCIFIYIIPIMRPRGITFTRYILAYGF